MWTIKVWMTGHLANIAKTPCHWNEWSIWLITGLTDLHVMTYTLMFWRVSLTADDCTYPFAQCSNVQNSEKLLLWCVRLTRWCAGWTNSFENLNSDLRNVPKLLRKTVIYGLRNNGLHCIPYQLFENQVILSNHDDHTHFTFIQRRTLPLDKGCVGASCLSYASSNWQHSPRLIANNKK